MFSAVSDNIDTALLYPSTDIEQSENHIHTFATNAYFSLQWPIVFSAGRGYGMSCQSAK
jgi:hypothetical protein